MVVYVFPPTDRAATSLTYYRHCGYRIGDGPGSFQKGGDGLGSYIACIIMFVCAMDQAHGLDQNKIKWADWAMETGGMEYLLLFF